MDDTFVVGEQVTRVLVAEDDPMVSRLIVRLLRKHGYEVTTAANGVEALSAVLRDRPDVVITDWLMPKMDGIELVRRIRDHCRPGPIILVVTALDSESGREHALEAGADGYLNKSRLHQDLEESIAQLLAQLYQPVPKQKATVDSSRLANDAPFVGVCVAASTGGPPALASLVGDLPAGLNASYFVVQHGPVWMLTTLAARLSRLANIEVKIAVAEPIRSGVMYVAPGGKHLLINENLELELDDSAPVNHIRPAADPLFYSAARILGRRSVAVVLTGLGRDAALGSAAISREGGSVIVQDPKYCSAPYMPESVLQMGFPSECCKLSDMAGSIVRAIERASQDGTETDDAKPVE